MRRVVFTSFKENFCETHYKFIIERGAHETLNLNCQFNCCFNIFDFNYATNIKDHCYEK